MSAVAVLNAGSSSIKFAIFERAASARLLIRGQVEGIGAKPRAQVLSGDGELLEERDFPLCGFDHEDATREIIQIRRRWAEDQQIVAVGHRVVHGGDLYSEPVVVSEEVLERLKSLIPLAPLHQPHNLAPINAIRALRPEMTQVACFDTAFHRHQPHLARAFALPRQYDQDGIRRYGFHGISYEYLTARLREIAPDIANRRIVLAHLGNGASLCAVCEGRSIASTMGFTAVDGLMMGTRCGALDPGVLVHLMDRYGLDARALEDLIYRKSGLLGVSGISSDMRTLRQSTEPAAKEATALFVYRIVREIGSLAAALGGLDAIVFSGGIGEHDASTRAEIAEGCDWLGLKLDATANELGATMISTSESRVRAYVIPTNEEKMIADQTLQRIDNIRAND